MINFNRSLCLKHPHGLQRGTLKSDLILTSNPLHFRFMVTFAGVGHHCGVHSFLSFVPFRSQLMFTLDLLVIITDNDSVISSQTMKCVTFTSKSALLFAHGMQRRPFDQIDKTE